MFSSLDAQQRENDLIATISTLEEKVLSLEKEKASHHVRAEGAVTDKANLASQLADVTSELKKKEEDNDMLSLEIKSLQTKLDNSEENYSKQKEGFVEELNKMNVVLKQRGESITRLEEKCQSNEKEFKVFHFLNCVLLFFLTFPIFTGKNRNAPSVSCRKREKD